MPRAKRTDRAEARRRHRAQIAGEGVESVDGDEGNGPDSAATRPARPGARPARGATPTTTPQQAGIGYAFRAAFRPAHLREDLVHWREIAGSRALLVGAAVSIATAVALLVTTTPNPVLALLAQYFLLPPPIVPIFVAGFFARRASYISGLIAGVVGAIGLSAVLALNPGALGIVATASPGTSGASPSAAPASGSPQASTASSANPSAASANPSASASAAASPQPSSSAASPGASGATPSAAPTPTPTPLTQADVDAFRASLIRDAFLISPVAGIFFASAAAWYRRFLRLANPNRAAQRGSSNRSRQQQRRR